MKYKIAITFDVDSNDHPCWTNDVEEDVKELIWAMIEMRADFPHSRLIEISVEKVETE